MEFVVIAQGVTDSLSGGSGWVGAGLLGIVLGWLLMIHLPAKDKIIKDIIESKDKYLAETLDRKWKIIQQLTVDYQIQIKAVAEHCEKEIIQITTVWREDIKSLTGALQDLSEIVRDKRA